MKWSGTLKESLVLVLAACVPTAGLVAWRGLPEPAAPQAAERRPDEVSVGDVGAWESPALWIDARSRDRFEADHVPGALPLNFDDWEGQLFEVLDAIQPDQRVVVYCGSAACGTSREVADRLRGVIGEITEIYMLYGGWDAWRKANP